MRQTSHQAGFTLVELIIVMAISSLLLVIAFAGQRQIRDRESFDAAINETIANITYVRNYAAANINDVGHGNSTQTVLVGDSMEFDNGHLDEGKPLGEMEPIYAQASATTNLDANTYQLLPFGSDANLCDPTASDDSDECFERYFTVGDSLRVTSGATHTIYIVFIHTNQGLLVCQEISDSNVTLGDACASTGGATFQFKLSDAAGFTATIEINGQNGLPRRIN